MKGGVPVFGPDHDVPPYILRSALREKEMGSAARLRLCAKPY